MPKKKSLRADQLPERSARFGPYALDLAIAGFLRQLDSSAPADDASRQKCFQVLYDRCLDSIFRHAEHAFRSAQATSLALQAQRRSEQQTEPLTWHDGTGLSHALQRRLRKRLDDVLFRNLPAAPIPRGSRASRDQGPDQPVYRHGDEIIVLEGLLLALGLVPNEAQETYRATRIVSDADDMRAGRRERPDTSDFEHFRWRSWRGTLLSSRNIQIISNSQPSLFEKRRFILQTILEARVRSTLIERVLMRRLSLLYATESQQDYLALIAISYAPLPVLQALMPRALSEAHAKGGCGGLTSAPLDPFELRFVQRVAYDDLWRACFQMITGQERPQRSAILYRPSDLMMGNPGRAETDVTAGFIWQPDKALPHGSEDDREHTHVIHLGRHFFHFPRFFESVWNHPQTERPVIPRAWATPGVDATLADIDPDTYLRTLRRS